MPSPAAAPRAAPARKLSYKEQRELDSLPGRIEALEAEQASVAARLADPALYVKEPQAVAALQARHVDIDTELLSAMERWEMLGAR